MKKYENNFPKTLLRFQFFQNIVLNELLSLGGDVFLELSCFFDDPVDVSNLISGSSAFSKSNLNICKFTVYVLLKTSLENFQYYFASM